MDFERFLDLLKALKREGVDYVLVGGVAVNLHGIVRATEDVDPFIRPSEDNVERLKRALRSLWDDPEIAQISARDFAGQPPTIPRWSLASGHSGASRRACSIVASRAACGGSPASRRPTPNGSAGSPIGSTPYSASEADPTAEPCPQRKHGTISAAAVHYRACPPPPPTSSTSGRTRRKTIPGCPTRIWSSITPRACGCGPRRARNCWTASRGWRS